MASHDSIQNNLQNDIEDMIFQRSINDWKKCQEHIICLTDKIKQQKIMI